MTDAEKKDFERNKNKVSIRSMYFNRFLLIRYLTAGYFFANMYWFILLAGYHKPAAIIPALLLISSIFVIVEQVKKYHDRGNDVPHAFRYYLAQLLVNLIMAGLSYTSMFSEIFPFVRPNGANFMISILIIGALGCLVLERKIYNISNGLDKSLSRIKDYRNSINL
ncbi:hypothetical protein M5C72_11815 [Companilactobacillus allii]|uniref:PTS cellobiose transporter subunit IIA n=1 Tax=Companilactobacillus allii TaxID=1847728 RepID=A0A1P8Q0N3_9LACO|nr:hypothetical protein [Companilactobacillus allii]APX71434.1 hypothetical protein BTM29_02180 [Companilactobacillus allii]USQ68515.1 hypothetical protein M5C72_11815 [Companilactobacillus allii]